MIVRREQPNRDAGPHGPEHRIGPGARVRIGEGTEPRVKVKVDLDLCVGHGRCYVLAPDVFAPDDFGHCEIIVAEVDTARVKAMVEKKAMEAFIAEK